MEEDWKQQERPASVSEEACEPSSSEPSGPQVRDGFIYHRVTKLDTLAGLAIKYGVTVSDIKRANGILSDNAMFARECIKIPQGQLPIGEEAQVLFARLMSGYGRDASLNAKERRAPGTVSITQLPGSPSASRSSNFGGSNVGSEAVDDEPGTPYSRRSDKSSEPGDVELIERSLTSDGAAYGYGSDRVRRRATKESSLPTSRHGSVSAASQLGNTAAAAVGWLSNATLQGQNGLSGPSPLSAAGGRHSFNSSGSSSAHGGAGPSSSGGNTWSQFSTAIAQGGSTLVQKIKRAASQPALAPGGLGGGGFGDAADAVLLAGGGGGGCARIPSAGLNGGSIDLLARGAGLGPPLLPRKDTKGD